jgi:hypothetical protein
VYILRELIIFLFIFLPLSVFSQSGEPVVGENRGTDTQSVEDPNYFNFLSQKISEDMYRLNSGNLQEGEVDCVIANLSDTFKEFGILWDDVRKVNAKLVDRIFNNFDKFLNYAKHFSPKTNDPNLVATNFYLFKAFVDILTDNEEEETIIDRETMQLVWGVFQGPPFNVPAISGVDEIISQIDKLEVSKKKKGKHKGAKQLIIHGRDGDDIRVGGEHFSEQGLADFPVNLLIEDEAEVVFYESEFAVSRSGKKTSRDKKVIDYIEDANPSYSDYNFNENTKDQMISFVKDKKYDNRYPPFYFEAEGIELEAKDDASLDLGGVDVGFLGSLTNLEVNGGVLLPGNFSEVPGQRVNSFVGQISTTGLIGFVSFTGSF